MIYRFQDFELDSLNHELRQDGVPVKLEPQVFRLIDLLISNHSRLVSKNELLQKIWNGRIVSQSTINSRIRLARLAIGDDGKGQRLIKTIHNRGFRFVGQVIDSSKVAVPKNKSSDCKRGKTSIAVMEFNDLSDEPDHDQFANGLCQDIIIALAKLPRLRIASGDSVFKSTARPGEIDSSRDLLDPGYILEGSVRRIDDRLRITVQLMDASTGFHIWAERYERKRQNVFDLHDEITREIVSSLQVKLSSGEQARAWSSGTRNFEAWETLVKARQFCLTHRRRYVMEGRALAKRAISLDPTYVSALHWLAYSYWAESRDGWSPDSKSALQRSMEILKQALAIDQTDANLLSLLALVHLSLNEHETAILKAEKAITFGPGNAHAFSNSGFVLAYSGRPKDAIPVVRKAMEYAPLYNAGTAAILAVALWLVGKNEEAVAEAKNCLRIDPDYYYAYCILAVVYSETGQNEAARNAGKEILRIYPSYTTGMFANSHPIREPASKIRFVAGLRNGGVPD
ncbi:MAG: winged helix-turn-helix domain-containing protein [Parasphingorhabdus sp.]